MILIGAMSYTIATNEELITAVDECMQEDPNFYENILLYRTSSNVTLTEKQVKFNELTTNFKLPAQLQAAMYIIVYGIRILMCIYATNLYYKKLTKNIEKVDKLDLSPDMKRSVIYRKCGTLPFIIAAIVGFLEWQLF